MRLKLKDDGVCSGVLVSPRHVLTAAHCYDAQIQVFLSGTNSPMAGKFITYSEKGKVACNGEDIAIVELSKPVPQKYKAIPIASNSLVNAPAKTRAVGFGGELSKKNAANIVISRINREKPKGITCTIIGVPPEDIPQNTGFSSEEGNRPGTEKGDSGGPLFVYDQKKQPYVGFVVSLGHPGWGSVNTLVPAYAAWITRIIGSQPTGTKTQPAEGNNNGIDLCQDENNPLCQKEKPPRDVIDVCADPNNLLCSE